MSKIKVMDEILANKIAAGEVVERCMSVVKELVENSIDAGSSEIKVELQEAGTKLIRVTDNGSGMDKEDAVLSFNRHATSKIEDEDDLYRINTLGFRGEALASIASVSDITLKTSTGNVGTVVNIKGGKVIDVITGDARRGTIVEVKELFYNTPARLKHMKSLHTELASITEYMNKLALANPSIRFTLINNNNVLLQTDGSNNLLKTISDIYGMEITKKMVEISGEDDDYVINGYISLPEVHKSNRKHMINLVNGRVVRNVELNKTINDAYHSYKPDNRYPVVVINIEVDPSLIDVNIHPTKMDIKFSKMEELISLVNELTVGCLKQETKIVDIGDVKNVQDVKEDTCTKSTVTKKEEKSKIKYEELTLDFNIISESEEQYKKIPRMYPVGLVHGTYIICQNDEGMYIIDQHAAKERINYELYKNKLGTPNNESISLLIPVTIELTNNEFIVLKENIDLLKDMKFDIEEFGVNSIIVKAHPTWLPTSYEEESIRRIIEIVIQLEKGFKLEKFNENVAINLSCKMSIKANTNIGLEEMEALINELRNCDNPFNCPHGRPTIITYTKYELERLFKRSGF